MPVLEFVTQIGGVQVVKIEIGLDHLVTYEGMIDWVSDYAAKKDHNHSLSNLDGILPTLKGGTGNTTGTATSASKLSPGRTIRANLASNTAVLFDGTTNIEPGVVGVLGIINGGTGATTAEQARANLGVSSADHTHPYLPVNTGATAPTGTTRYNCEGYLYATRLYGAVYNDYAEAREAASADALIPGTVVEEIGGGVLDVCGHHRSKVAYIVSDTYGMLIGQDDNRELETSVALAGRILARVYGNADDYRIGDLLCAGDNGTLRKMSANERRNDPLSLVGVVVDVPTYTGWHGISVDGRVWVKLKG